MDNLAQPAGIDADRTSQRRSQHRLFIESFGVRIEIETNSIDAIEVFRGILPANLADNFTEFRECTGAHLFTYEWNDDTLDSLYENGEWVSVKRDRKELLNILGTRIRLTVAEFANDRVFVHAGVVAVDGRAIIVPGKSLSGKTTLVAELVRQGAVYFSDEYAVFDSDGLVYPFTKPLSIRLDGEMDQSDIEVVKLGGFSGTGPLPVGLIVFTKFAKGAKWKPKPVNGAKAILELIRDTIPIRLDPKFTIAVLNRAITKAILIKSKRNEAADAASAILKLLENPNNLSR